MIFRSGQERSSNSTPSPEPARYAPIPPLQRRASAEGDGSPHAVDPGRRLVDLEAPGDPTVLPISIDPTAVLSNLPLADVVLNLSSFVLNPTALDPIFQAHRGRSFEQVLTFPTFVRLIADALLQHQGSGRQSFQRADEEGLLPTSVEAAYGKLRRVPVSLSLGFLEAVSAHLRQIFPASASARVPPECLHGLTPVILDGKTLKRVAKRLKATRDAPGKISGGKLLVAMAPQSGLVLSMAADLDGEANEARLVPDLLPGVGRQVPSHRLWIADRQFGDPVQIGRFLAQDGDHLVVRWDGRTSFHADPERPAVTGTDAKGRTVIQEWGWLGAVSNKRRRLMRRITLVRPGEENVIVMTDLLSDGDYPAPALLEVYLARWRIERVFQQITEVFSLKRLIGSTARATIFQGASCLILYNLIQVVRGYIAAGRPEISLTEELSSEQIFYDVRRQLTAVYELVSVPEVVARVDRRRSLEELCAWLSGRLAGVWTDRWKKATNKQPRPKKPEMSACYGAHNSVHRLVIGQKGGTDPP